MFPFFAGKHLEFPFFLKKSEKFCIKAQNAIQNEKSSLFLKKIGSANR